MALEPFFYVENLLILDWIVSSHHVSLDVLAARRARPRPDIHVAVGEIEYVHRFLERDLAEAQAVNGLVVLAQAQAFIELVEHANLLIRYILIIPFDREPDGHQALQ